MVPLKFSITKAVLGDLSDVVNLFNSYRIFYQQDSDLIATRLFISERLQKRDSVVFIARGMNGEAVGFTQLYPTFSSQSMQRMWILNDLYVAEPYRKLGVASGLLETAKRFSSESASKGLLLCTQVTNQKAQALYRKNGFEKVADFEWYFLKS